MKLNNFMVTSRRVQPYKNIRSRLNNVIAKPNVHLNSPSLDRYSFQVFIPTELLIRSQELWIIWNRNIHMVIEPDSHRFTNVFRFIYGVVFLSDLKTFI